jgi:hypothetical protein
MRGLYLSALVVGDEVSVVALFYGKPGHINSGSAAIEHHGHPYK